GNRERIAKLLRFASTTSDTVSVSFADYKARKRKLCKHPKELSRRARSILRLMRIGIWAHLLWA
ncbi:MAG: hypothetical protein EBX61_09680, partial [Betaproteobacteria bacterium]|nr:hypothetical protein [Betaproteobacteria bacterium]